VLVQRHAADEFQSQEWPAVLGRAGFVNGGNLRVVQPAEDLRLLGEALEERRRNRAGPDDFQGDGSSRVVLLGLVDDAMPPTPSNRTTR
jgi:hypothetical protein